MARAVAGESGVGFISASASEFIEMYMGLGASRVRDLFNTVCICGCLCVRELMRTSCMSYTLSACQQPIKAVPQSTSEHCLAG